MANQLFTDGYGRLTTDRFLFQHHVDGVQLRHKADQIDLNPQLTINSTPNIPNVQAALTQVGLELNVLELSGKGFITVGDGFDTYHFSNPADPAYVSPNPDPAYDSTVPAFNTYLDHLLNISDPTDINYNPLHARIRDGGVVLIKTGTYKFTGTVNVPPGIILMGEGYGTKIVNQMGSPAPLFTTVVTTTTTSIRTPDSGVDVNKFIFNRDVVFVNLTIADNLLVPKFTGDTSYKTPINNNSIAPLVNVTSGTSVICENVKFVGKVQFSSGTIVSSITSFAVKLDNTIPTASGSYLKISNCFIDGFAQPISFNSVGGRNDYLEVTNSKIRSHGYLNLGFGLDGSSQEANCVIHMNDNNADISGNEFYGNHDALTTICYIKSKISTPAVQDKSNITVNSNTFIIGKGGVSTISGDAIIVGTAGLSNNAFLLDYGNSLGQGFTLTVNQSLVFSADDQNGITIGDGTTTIVASSPNFSTNGNGTTLNGSLFLSVNTITATPYAVDSSLVFDYTILVDLTTIAAATTITLPAPAIGRTLIIKDRDGLASVHNITVARNSFEKIEGVSADIVFSANFGSWTFVADGTNWSLIS